MSQLQKSSLTPTNFFAALSRRLVGTSSGFDRLAPARRSRHESLPLLAHILFCDFNFRSSLLRRLHYFSMFGFDSAHPQPLESSHLPDDFHPRFRYD